ncbi:MAG TPA: hypothetical protein DCY72_02385 [Ruminococcaceae bacterium]|nr:hypothetical protein [Oscillospiraceae bacterium]
MNGVFTKEWWVAAGVRALKTFAEGALAVIGTQAAFIHEVNWLMVLSGGALAAVVSFLLALKGLPEVGGERETEN